MGYAYNDRGELTVADYTGANQPADAIYDYDANGNRADAGFTIGGHNQPTTDANFVYTYDAEGNRTSRTSLTSGDYETYSWDNRNRLIQVAHRAANHTFVWTVDYAYDAQNRMLSRTQTLAGQSPSMELFVYDGNQAVLQTDAAGNVTHRYLWGESVDQVLADETVDLISGIGTTRWTLTDHLNTVRDLATYNNTNDTTSIVDHIIYDAFGKLTSESSPANSTSLKFTGHYLDPLTNQQWNLNRWYDPGLHQWLSVDPILFEAGDPNPRRYVSNDPTNRTDPDGLAENWFTSAIRTSSNVVYIGASKIKRDIELYREFRQIDPEVAAAKAEKERLRAMIGPRPDRHDFVGGLAHDAFGAALSMSKSDKESFDDNWMWLVDMADGSASAARQASKNGMLLGSKNSVTSDWLFHDNVAFALSATHESTPVTWGSWLNRKSQDLGAWMSGAKPSDEAIESVALADPFNNLATVIERYLSHTSQAYATYGHSEAVADGAVAMPFVEWAGSTILDIAITVGTLGVYALEGATIKQVLGHIGREAFERISPIPISLDALRDDAASVLKKSARYKSTAIGQYADGSLGIASSDPRVPRSQREWARERGIRVVDGVGHADDTLVNSGNFITGPLVSMEVDSPHGRTKAAPHGKICADCEVVVKENSVVTNNPFSGKKSRKRQ